MTVAQDTARRARRRRPIHCRQDALLLSCAFLLFTLLVLTIAYSHESSGLFLKTLVRNSASELDEICKQDPGEHKFIKSRPALAILIPGILVLFVGLAVVTDDYFVPSLEIICEKLNLSEDVAGATFMAAGSSAPELFTSLLATFVTKDDVGVGTIVGSAVFNVLVIIGVSAIMAGSVLKLDWRPLLRDSAFYALSISLLLVFVLGSSKGAMQWWEGLILIGGYICYIAFMKWGNQRYMKFCERVFMKGGHNEAKEFDDLEKGVGGLSESTDFTSSSAEETLSSSDSTPVSSPGVDVYGPVFMDTELDEQARRRLRNVNPRFRFRSAGLAIMAANRFASMVDDNTKNGPLHMTSNRSNATDPKEHTQQLVDNDESNRTFLGIEVPSSILGRILFPVTFIWNILFKLTIRPNCAKRKNANYWPFTFILSILWIGALSYGMVEAARLTGCLIGVPAAVMGLTVLAAGTSIPDALASVAVAKQGQGDMAVSNALGSNVFDILLGLGLPIFLGGLINKEPLNITVTPTGTVVIPIAILFAVLILLIAVTAAFKWKLRPLLGYVLLGTYVLFLTYSFLDAFVFKIGS